MLAPAPSPGWAQGKSGLFRLHSTSTVVWGHLSLAGALRTHSADCWVQLCVDNCLRVPHHMAEELSELSPPRRASTSTCSLRLRGLCPGLDWDWKSPGEASRNLHCNHRSGENFEGAMEACRQPSLTTLPEYTLYLQLKVQRTHLLPTPAFCDLLALASPSHSGCPLHVPRACCFHRKPSVSSRHGDVRVPGLSFPKDLAL